MNSTAMGRKALTVIDSKNEKIDATTGGHGFLANTPCPVPHGGQTGTRQEHTNYFEDRANS